MAKFDEVKDKFRKTVKNIEFKNFDAKKVLDFVKKNVRYFAAGALFIILVVVLVKFTNQPEVVSTENELVATEEQGLVLVEVENAAVQTLIDSYYTAYAAGDVATLTTLATPVSANEQGYISMYSQFVDAFTCTEYHVFEGLDANSFLVSVGIEVIFTGVETGAPGLDFFYVRTNESGALYIDNLYSQYNMNQNENALDTSIESLIEEYKKQDVVIQLQQTIQQAYNEAVTADVNLANMINTTIPAAQEQWLATVIAQNMAEENTEATEPSSEVVAESETLQEEVPAESEAPEEEAPVESETGENTSETVVTTYKVNVREAADQSSNKLGQVEQGTTLTRVGTEGDWSIVEFEGGTGYIKSEYLSTGAATGEEGTATSDGLAEGTVVRLENTTNIRSSMDTNSDKVGVAYPGEEVTVEMSYAEGWTKVKWDGKTGYIKTDLLQ